MTSVQWQDLLKAAGESGLTPLPPGEYDMYVEAATAKQSSSGKDMIALRFVVESGPHEGRKVFSNIVISPESTAALGFLFRKMGAFGLSSEYFEKNPALEQVAEDLENRRCVADVTVREFQGQERNDVNTLKPPPDGVTHHASGSVPDDGMSMFASGGVISPNGGHPEHVAAHHGSHHAPPDLPF